MDKKNLASAIVATAPSPATSGTSLVVLSGEGGWFPTVFPFYATAAPDGELATPSNAEIVKVTGIAGNTLTIVRAQRGTTALSIDVGWRITAAIYAEDSSDDIYVEQFGAVGDNSTDDTAAIQAAIDYAAANRGRNVVFGAKTYKVTASLELASYVNLIGKGGSPSNANGTIIRTTSTTASIVHADITTTSMTSVRIRGIRLEGAFSGTGDGIYLENTGSGGSHPPYTYFNFEDLYIVGCGGVGFNVECLIVSSLTNVVSESNDGGFFFNGSAAGGFSTVNTSCNLSSCFANGNTTYGFNLDHSTYMSMQNCAADSNGTSYIINTCNAIALSGCGYEYGDPDSATPGDGYVISGGSANIGLYDCYSLNNKDIAVWVKGSSYAITLVGFQENSPAGGAANSFKVESGSIVTLIDPNYTTAVSNAGTLTYLTDGAGGMSIPAGVFFNSTAYVASALTLDNDIHMLPYQQIQDQSGHAILELGAFGTPANYIGVETSEAGNAATIYAAGSDSSVDINVVSKGASSRLQHRGVSVPTISSTDILTNKRVTPRTGTVASSATPTINTDDVDYYTITAQAVDITSFTTNLSGTPTDGQRLWIAITGTASRAITWGASFEASTVALPTTTSGTNRLDVGFVWNSVTSKWRCVTVA